MTEARRPHGRADEPAPEEQAGSQRELDRHARDGGDAPAAGTVVEREDLARDEDDTWGDEQREPGPPDADARSDAPEDG